MCIYRLVCVNMRVYRMFSYVYLRIPIQLFVIVPCRGSADSTNPLEIPYHHNQPSTPGVIAAVDEGDFRANLAHGELRSLGAEEAFPEKCVRGCVECGGGGVIYTCVRVVYSPTYIHTCIYLFTCKCIQLLGGKHPAAQAHALLAGGAPPALLAPGPVRTVALSHVNECLHARSSQCPVWSLAGSSIHLYNIAASPGT